MKKTYSFPVVECTSVNTNTLMQSESSSVGGQGDQNLFNAPKRGGAKTF